MPEFGHAHFGIHEDLPVRDRLAEQERAKRVIRTEVAQDLRALRSSVEDTQQPEFLSALLQDALDKDASLEMLSISKHEQKDQYRHKEKTESRIEYHALNEDMTNAETTNEKAAEFHEEATEYEEHGQTLATTDLLPMNAEKAQEIERFFADHSELELANGVSIEVATDYGFETAQTDKIWEIAEKLGNPFFRDGAPDMVKLTDPKSRLWLSHLMGLVEGFDEITPTTQFADLPAEEMNALLALYQTTIAEQYPHLDVADGNFKWADLRAVGEQVVQSANKKRGEAGTELYAKVIHPKLRNAV